MTSPTTKILIADDHEVVRHGVRDLLTAQPGWEICCEASSGRDALDRWISWARRCRIPAFVDLQRRIVRHRDAIDATLESRISNGLIESTNTKIRLLTRIAFGFHGPEPLIALALLALGGKSGKHSPAARSFLRARKQRAHEAGMAHV